MSRKKKFVYADLNSIDGSRMQVSNPYTFKEILDKYGRAESGMDLLLWTDDHDENNKYDPIVYFGRLVFDDGSKHWYIEINKDEIEHLSKSKRFDNYSLREVIGDDEYLKIQRIHPEWL